MATSRVPGAVGRSEQCLARSPGRLGANDAADPDAPAWLQGDTPGVCGKNDAGDDDWHKEAVAPREIPVLCFDLERIERFLHGVAFWRVQHRHLNVQFKPDNDQFWKLLDKVMFWSDAKIGTLEVATASRKVVAQEVERICTTLLKEFMNEAANGPEAVMTWLNQQSQIRKIAEDGYKKTVQDVNKANQKIAGAMSTPLKVLRTVKFAADAVAEGIGIVNPLYTVGYTFVTVVAEEYSKAQAVAVVDSRDDAGGESMSESVQKGAVKAGTSDEAAEIYGKVPEKLEERFAQQAKKAQEQMKSHDAAIRKSEGKLRKHANAPVKKARTYDRIRQHVEKKTAANARLAKAAAREATAKSFAKAYKKALFLYQIFDWGKLGYEYGQDMQNYD